MHAPERNEQLNFEDLEAFPVFFRALIARNGRVLSQYHMYQLMIHSDAASSPLCTHCHCAFGKKLHLVASGHLCSGFSAKAY